VLQAPSRLEKLTRPKEAADDVSARRNHAANLREAHSHAADRDGGAARCFFTRSTDFPCLGFAKCNNALTIPMR
jgi:hypothetical protein